MKSALFPLINAVGCAALCVIAAVQWRQNESHRALNRRLQVDAHAVQDQRDQALQRVDSLTADLADLKRSLLETQKAADEASRRNKEQTVQLVAANTVRDQTTAERDALRAQITQWEAAIQERDRAIIERNEDLLALRKKLEEAVAQLKKAGAQ
jgi:septal ring factor EnvC (AmiA/AmiB activator)